MDGALLGGGQLAFWYRVRAGTTWKELILSAYRIRGLRLLSLGLILSVSSALATPSSENESDIDRLGDRSEWFLGRRRLPDGSVGSSLRLKAANELRDKLNEMQSQRAPT